MHIESVALNNWMPFRGEQCLPVLPALPMAIVAKYADNPRRSNWGGKTAFLEALDWCLYGKHRKRLHDAVIHGDEDSTTVEVVLTGGIKVSRTYPRGGPESLCLERPGQDKLYSEAAQCALLRLLRLNYEDSRMTTCVSQGDVEALVSRLSSERRAVFTRWLELDVWGRLSESVRAEERRAREAHATLLLVHEEVEPRSIEDIEGDLGQARAGAEGARTLLDVVQGKLRAWRDANTDASAAKDLATVVAEGKALRAELKATPATPVEGVSAAAEAERVANAELGAAAAKEREAKRLVQDGFDGKCPVMRAPCPVSEQVLAAGSAARKALTEANLAVAACSKAAGEARCATEELRSSARDRADKERRVDDLTARWKELKARVDAREAKLRALGHVDAAELEAQQRELTEALASARAREAELVAEVKARTGFYERRAERMRKVEVEAARARAAAIAARCVGPNGVPREKAVASLGGLQDTANALLQGTGLSFALAWERETQELSLVCYTCGHAFGASRKVKQCPACCTARGNKRAEEVEILVDDGSGAVEDARVKSGAARALVGCALRLAGGMLLRELRGSQVGWAKVDEPFGSLDAENRVNMVSAFTSMLGAVGLEQAFVVSHDAALLDKLPARLVITRDGCVSRIELEG